MPGLTKQQGRALDFIRAFDRQHGYAPSFREIADAIGVASKSSAYRVVTALEERGFISRPPGRLARAINLVSQLDPERERCAQIAIWFGRPDIAFAIRREPVTHD